MGKHTELEGLTEVQDEALGNFRDELKEVVMAHCSGEDVARLARVGLNQGHVVSIIAHALSDVLGEIVRDYAASGREERMLGKIELMIRKAAGKHVYTGVFHA